MHNVTIFTPLNKQKSIFRRKLEFVSVKLLTQGWKYIAPGFKISVLVRFRKFKVSQVFSSLAHAESNVIWLMQSGWKEV